MAFQSSDAGGGLMRTASKLALAAAGALAIGGAAAAATKPESHVMDVALPDGSTAHIQYYGDVAPRVTIAPGPVEWAPMAFPRLGNLDAMMAQMARERDAMIRQAQQISRRASIAPGVPVNVVSYGTAPAGTTSVSVVSVSNGGGTCTRTTRTISEGAGKAPKVESTVSGTCSGAAAGTSPQTKPAAARQSAVPVDHT
jgi:hypothetical protein